MLWQAAVPKHSACPVSINYKAIGPQERGNPKKGRNGNAEGRAVRYSKSHPGLLRQDEESVMRSGPFCHGRGSKPVPIQYQKGRGCLAQGADRQFRGDPETDNRAQAEQGIRLPPGARALAADQIDANHGTTGTERQETERAVL